MNTSTHHTQLYIGLALIRHLSLPGSTLVGIIVFLQKIWKGQLIEGALYHASLIGFGTYLIIRFVDYGFSSILVMAREEENTKSTSADKTPNTRQTPSSQDNSEKVNDPEAASDRAPQNGKMSPSEPSPSQHSLPESTEPDASESSDEGSSSSESPTDEDAQDGVDNTEHSPTAQGTTPTPSSTGRQMASA